LAYHNKELTRALRSIQSGHYYLPPDPRKFRVSSLPYCPLLHVIGKIENPDRKIPFESGHYFHMGHAAHQLWQTVARYKLPDNFIGDWQCTRQLHCAATTTAITATICNRVVNFCSFNQATKQACPHKLRNCSRYLNYKELEIEFHGMTGHTDMLIKQGKYYSLIDIKTTSDFLFLEPKKAISYGYYPSKKYLEQISVYCVMLERKYKIKIKDYTIAYVARNKALFVGRDNCRALRLFSNRLTDSIRKSRLKRMHIYQKQFTIANNWLEAAPVTRRKLTQNLFASRPCHRSKDYFEKMAHGFFTPCKHHTKGHCYNGKMKKILQKLENNV